MKNFMIAVMSGAVSFAQAIYICANNINQFSKMDDINGRVIVTAENAKEKIMKIAKDKGSFGVDAAGTKGADNITDDQLMNDLEADVAY